MRTHPEMRIHQNEDSPSSTHPASRRHHTRWAPLVQGSVGCVVLAILLTLLNACGDGSPVASADAPVEASAAPADAAARAVASALSLAASQQKDAFLEGDHSGSVQVVMGAADQRRFQLHFDQYSDDGVSFLHGTLEVTWDDEGIPGFSGDLYVRVGDSAPTAAGLDGDIIHLPGGGSMTLIIDWPTPVAADDRDVTDPLDRSASDMDVQPATIRLNETAREVIWRTIRAAAERGAGVYEGDASGRARIRLSRSVATNEEGSVIEAEANLVFERYGSTARFALGGELRLKYRRDTQGRSRAVVDGEIQVYTSTGVGLFVPDADLVRQWLDTRFSGLAPVTMADASAGQDPSQQRESPNESPNDSLRDSPDDTPGESSSARYGS